MVIDLARRYVWALATGDADLELNEWGLAPADTSIDPNPEILAASPTQVSGKRPETVAERFGPTRSFTPSGWSTAASSSRSSPTSPTASPSTS